MVDVVTETRQGVCYVGVECDMTIYEASELKDKLLASLLEGDEVEVNLSKVGEIDTSGVQLLMLMKLESQRLNKSIRLTSHSNAVQDVMDVYRIASFFGDPILVSSEESVH